LNCWKVSNSNAQTYKVIVLHKISKVYITLLRVLLYALYPCSK
jgi:hypothetical protein